MNRFGRISIAFLAVGLLVVPVLIAMLAQCIPGKTLQHLTFEKPLEQQIEEQVASVSNGRDPDLPLPVIVNGNPIRNLHYDEIRTVLSAEGFTEANETVDGNVCDATFISPDRSVEIRWEPHSGELYADNVDIKLLAEAKAGASQSKIEIGKGGFAFGDAEWVDKWQPICAKGGGVVSLYPLSRGAYYYEFYPGNSGELERVFINIANVLDDEYRKNNGFTKEDIRGRVEMYYGIPQKQSLSELFADWIYYIRDLIT